jgi:hypothetical protein
MNEAARIDHLESVMLRRIARRSGSCSAVNIPRLAASVFQWRGRVTVEHPAAEAGVSRQSTAVPCNIGYPADRLNSTPGISNFPIVRDRVVSCWSRRLHDTLLPTAFGGERALASE